ncbi:hypothetical protein E4L95_22225 [Paracoccus liaowanqingii]|uniref:Uncharacterized protein n=1 Tax=Paracoccus liaowanqingii TaxID=2560053 RepID=A0A4Z1BFB7_9RHOB|nr:hypothetical protein [Paracoccus liaowanqingii]TGN37730.1 hypothetical protein E4L95_22225 [Paracoccus liaowanqingii]
MTRKVFLIDIYGKPHNFVCPPWRVVQIRDGVKATEVQLTNGRTTPTYKVKECSDDVRRRFSLA